VTQSSSRPLILDRLQQFLQTESAGGVILMACTVLALAWANSPWAETYFRLWHTDFTVGFPGAQLSMDLHHWINDGLMVLFFFVVGLEIKRELLVGHLSRIQQAMLPIFGALGGMLAPALIYIAINAGGGALHGWGVPTATDIAFALAIMALLGPRVPVGLKVFLVALAIVDDLGAVVVIALFYTEQLNLAALALAAAGLAAAAIMNLRGVSRPLPYALIGIVVWLAVLSSGIHATIAGVLLALCIPARSRIDVAAFHERCRALLARLEATVNPRPGVQPLPSAKLRLSGEQQEILAELENTAEAVQPPLDTLEHNLHPWVAFGIMPLFALSNAGVTLPREFGAALADPVALGVMLGLLLGKQLGVTTFVWLSVRLKLAELPANVSWKQVYAAAWVCGVGFTMSLFIANLAFGADPRHLDDAKIGILLASTTAGIVGYILLRAFGRTSAAGVAVATEAA
jgi:Na+:H+ antiporter, NhaA family